MRREIIFIPKKKGIFFKNLLVCLVQYLEMYMGNVGKINLKQEETKKTVVETE